MSGMHPFLKLARKQLKRKKQKTDALDALVVEHRSFQPMAQKLMKNGFSTVHAHSLVALWSIVESTIEDCVLLIFERAPEIAESHIQVAGYKIKGGTLESMDNAARHRAYMSLEGQARKARSVGDGYIELLRTVGLRLRISQDSLDTFSEVNAVRNCILHNGSIIDDRAASSVSQLTGRKGEQIQVDRETYQRYFESMREFATSLLDTVIGSEYAQSPKSGA